MTDYSYLHILLRGEVDGATQTFYSWNAGDDRAWKKSLVTPGAAIRRFLNAGECYILQQSAEGHCFSLIARNPVKGSDGYEMISVFVDNECSLTGKQLVALFTALEKSFIAEVSPSDDAVKAALAAAGIPAQPVMRSSWLYKAPAEPVKREEGAYRTYISNSELVTIFSFPSQPDYSPYRCVIVVPATASLRPGVKMPRITAPIRKQYSVVVPDGVTVSADSAYDGERLTVTFTRPGFDSHTETVTVGNPSAFARIEGSTIRIRQPRECGIRFTRRVGLSVTSAKGTPLNGYTISVNGRSISTMEPFVEFTEKDLCDSDKVEIKVASNNYMPVKMEKSTDEILAAEQLEIVLQPIEQGVTLRLDFGDGRVIEQFISIEKNTPEYNRLHSGNFHGFRAYRMVTPDHSEVYNVDVRFNGRPVAPNFETARQEKSDEQTQSAHTAPVFENVSDRVGSDREPIDTAVPTLPDEENADRQDENPEQPEKPAGSMTKWILAAAAALVVLVVVLVLVLPRGTKLDVAPEAEVIPDDSANPAAVTDPAATPVATDVPAAPAPDVASAGFTTDAAYLNSNTVWDTARLTSPQGRQLVEAFAAGDIDAVASNDYFAEAGKCTNSKALTVLNLMWRAKGSPTAKRITAEMKKAAQGGSIDLAKLIDRLARFQPVEADANTLPRPTL